MILHRRLHLLEPPDLLTYMVGVAGFEPTASSSRTKRATKLRHTPHEATPAYRTGPATCQTPGRRTPLAAPGCIRLVGGVAHTEPMSLSARRSLADHDGTRGNAVLRVLRVRGAMAIHDRARRKPRSGPAARAF